MVGGTEPQASACANLRNQLVFGMSSAVRRMFCDCGGRGVKTTRTFAQAKACGSGIISVGGACLKLFNPSGVDNHVSASGN